MCLVCVCVCVCECACVVCECLCICVCAPSLSGRTGKTLGASQHCPGREGRSRQKLIQTHTHTHAQACRSLWMVAVTMTRGLEEGRNSLSLQVEFLAPTGGPYGVSSHMVWSGRARHP